MRKFKVTVNGVAYEVEVEEMGGAAPAPATPPAPAAPRAQVAASPAPPPAAVSGKTVVAPMPGTIKSIAVKPGDTVKRGQVLCVFEAMKMENEIKSGMDGRVASVSVNVGDPVNTGQTIMQLS